MHAPAKSMPFRRCEYLILWRPRQSGYIPSVAQQVLGQISADDSLLPTINASLPMSSSAFGPMAIVHPSGLADVSRTWEFPRSTPN